MILHKILKITGDGMEALACSVLLWKICIDSYNIDIELVVMSHESSL